MHIQTPDDGRLEGPFEAIASGLIEKGLVIVPNAVPPSVIAALSERCSGLSRSEFDPASIGRGRQVLQNRFVRQNKIRWMEPDDPSTQTWFDWTGALSQYLNRSLYLGLFSFETHFTLYEPGDRYKRHLDAFRGERNRMVSIVTYLNDGWQPDQGGELVLYPPEAGAIRITPESGTVVVFLSEEIPHEVLPTSRTRYGVAGWFRVNTSMDRQIDPQE